MGNAEPKARAVDDPARPPVPGRVPTEVAPAPAEALRAGTLVAGRYRIESPLGRGGIGMVWLARDEQVAGRRVALKVLLEHEAASDWLRAKFGDEMRALARLHDPSIVAVTDSGRLPSGQPFLVMEYAPGVTLRARLAQGALPLADVAAIVAQLGRAVAAAHKDGVIHRDLKPENVMVRELGHGEWQVKVIDFGVATVGQAIEGEAHTTRAAGTRAYMAPEQLRGRPVAASDIYALAAIAHELLVGCPPFLAANDVELIEEQRRGLRERPSARRPDLPAACDALIQRGLAFDAECRPASAWELAEGLAAALRGAGPQTAAPRRAQLRLGRLGLAALVLAALGTAGVLAWRWTAERPAAPPRVPTAAGNTLEYALLVQRYRNGRPYRAPFALPGPLLFAVDDRIRLSVSSRRPGYLYVLNEGPARAGSPPRLNVLFPSTSSRGGSAAIAAGQALQIPEQSWLAFDEEQGQERLWLVWSEQRAAALEQVATFANPTDRGEVRDEERARRAREYLSAQPRAGLALVADPGRPRTRLSGPGDVLVAEVVLEHR